MGSFDISVAIVSFFMSKYQFTRVPRSFDAIRTKSSLGLGAETCYQVGSEKGTLQKHTPRAFFGLDSSVFFSRHQLFRHAINEASNHKSNLALSQPILPTRIFPKFSSLRQASSARTPSDPGRAGKWIKNSGLSVPWHDGGRSIVVADL